MSEEKKEKGYDREYLAKLWELDFEDLAKAPGQPGGRLREPRYVMQAKVALETRQLTRQLALETHRLTQVTLVLAVATIVLAIATIGIAAVEIVW